MPFTKANAAKYGRMGAKAAKRGSTLSAGERRLKAAYAHDGVKLSNAEARRQYRAEVRANRGKEPRYF